MFIDADDRHGVGSVPRCAGGVLAEYHHLTAEAQRPCAMLPGMGAKRGSPAPSTTAMGCHCRFDEARCPRTYVVWRTLGCARRGVVSGLPLQISLCTSPAGLHDRFVRVRIRGETPPRDIPRDSTFVRIPALPRKTCRMFPVARLPRSPGGKAVHPP